MIAKNGKDSHGQGYPRPQMARDWESLNGVVRFAIDPEAKWRTPQEVVWDRDITVPFAPETPSSGVHNTDYFKAVWYKFLRDAPDLKNKERLILHFGAVDFAATVWVNGSLATTHVGGYTPFAVDITGHLKPGEPVVIDVRAFDNPHDLDQNRGKQDWLKDAHGIWYPRTTGIWQTVWWEVVPHTYMSYLAWNPSMKDWTIGIDVELQGPLSTDLMLDVRLVCNGRKLTHEIHGLTEREVNLGRLSRTLNLSDIQSGAQLPDNQMPDLRRWLLWSPDSPNLIQAEVKLRTASGAAVDEVSSYCALRSFERNGDQLFLNGEPVSQKFRSGNRPGMLRLALEQGYWRESGMTPPNDAALEKDVLIAKSTFHGVRKHNKIEDPRYLYWSDVHGLLVWEELPSAYLFSPASVQNSINLWQEAIRRDRSHPCIIAWVPINESWQVPKLAEQSPEGELQRQFVSSMYYLTKTLTNGAVVVGNDGWELVVSDILAIHDYHWNPDVLRDRYANTDEAKKRLFEHEQPGGHVMLLGMDYRGVPIGLTEFGGIALSNKEGDWGYSTARTPEELRDRFVRLMDAITSLDMMQVFCYTELFDAYQEANGLFTMDREPKFDVETMRKAIFGQ